MPPGPPAPFIGPSLRDVKAALVSGRARLPVTIGHGAPKAVIEEVAGGYVLRALEENHVEAERLARSRSAEGHLVPEHLFPALEPGRELARGATAAELAAKLDRCWGELGPYLHPLETFTVVLVDPGPRGAQLAAVLGAFAEEARRDLEVKRRDRSAQYIPVVAASIPAIAPAPVARRMEIRDALALARELSAAGAVVALEAVLEDSAFDLVLAAVGPRPAAVRQQLAQLKLATDRGDTAVPRAGEALTIARGIRDDDSWRIRGALERAGADVRRVACEPIVLDRYRPEGF